MTTGHLQRRARAPQAKLERRAAIVRAAEALAARGLDFAVAELARRAGLAKGTLYLYFGTREEVLLAVHEKQTHEVLDVVERSLAAEAPSGEKVVRAGLRYLREHPEFYPLAANCRGMLEANVGTEAALGFKARLGARLERLGERIEALYPRLDAGEGTALLTNCYALIIGLWQQADPPSCLRRMMHRPELRMFRIDFDRQLTRALLDLWEAVQRRGQ